MAGVTAAPGVRLCCGACDPPGWRSCARATAGALANTHSSLLELVLWGVPHRGGLAQMHLTTAHLHEELPARPQVLPQPRGAHGVVAVPHHHTRLATAAAAAGRGPSVEEQRVHHACVWVGKASGRPAARWSSSTPPLIRSHPHSPSPSNQWYEPLTGSIGLGPAPHRGAREANGGRLTRVCPSGAWRPPSRRSGAHQCAGRRPSGRWAPAPPPRPPGCPAARAGRAPNCAPGTGRRAWRGAAAAAGPQSRTASTPAPCGGILGWPEGGRTGLQRSACTSLLVRRRSFAERSAGVMRHLRYT